MTFSQRPSCRLAYCDVSLKVATGCPSPYSPSAVTVTGPAVNGSVRLIGGVTPELFVTTISVGPLFVPSDRDPPLVVNSTLAPVAVPPDWPGVKVAVKATGS